MQHFSNIVMSICPGRLSVFLIPWLRYFCLTESWLIDAWRAIPLCPKMGFLVLVAPTEGRWQRPQGDWPSLKYNYQLNRKEGVDQLVQNYNILTFYHRALLLSWTVLKVATEIIVDLCYSILQGPVQGSNLLQARLVYKWSGLVAKDGRLNQSCWSHTFKSIEVGLV